MTRPRPRASTTAVALVAAAALAGCSSAEPPVDTSRDDRIAAITRARQAVVEPAQALGTAAAEVAVRLDAVVVRPGPDTLDGLREAMDDLDGARRDLEDVDLDADTVDVAAAGEAVAMALAAAEDLDTSTAMVATAATLAVETEEALDEVVAVWDEPGSRTELLEQFDTALVTVAALVDGLEPPGDACDGPVQERLEEAEFVAAATEELRGYVADADGTSFDARRAELAEAPWGVDASGVVRGPGASIDPDGCAAVGDAEAAAHALADGLEALQAALNPDDLQS